MVRALAAMDPVSCGGPRTDAQSSVGTLKAFLEDVVPELHFEKQEMGSSRQLSGLALSLPQPKFHPWSGN